MIPIPAEFTAPLSASSDPADAGLIEVERRQAALEAWSRSTKGKSDKECDRIADLDTSFEDLMADTPAHTLAGVAVKLRLLERYTADSCSWAPPCVETALATIAELGRLGNDALSASVSPELPALLARLPEVRAAHAKANEVADELMFGINAKKTEALARKNELPALRRAEEAALKARRAADSDIVKFPCRTLGDVLAKLHFFSEEEAKSGTPITDPGANWPLAVVAHAIADFERLLARGHAP
jgi:hypothetical protein